MKVLRRLPPTPEQISIVRRIQRGVSLIRGSAGSGKTSTALTALRATTGTAVNHLRNSGQLPANVLVLTYYNSLKGYISAVAEAELADYADEVRLYVMTFDKWAFGTLGFNGVDIASAEARLRALAHPFPRDTDFILDEVNYILGRFVPGELDQYLTRPRAGRGASPAMPQAMRQRLLDEVVRPYLAWKGATGISDFTDVALAMASVAPATRYDVVVVDEAQDLSTIQLRAIKVHAADDAAITVVTDTAQRIYPRGVVWSETGMAIAPNRSFRLTQNYRNTRQIAAVALSIADGLVMDDDGSLPDPELCTRDGAKPLLLVGNYPAQVAHVLALLGNIDLENETVGFLHLKGGGWFRYLRETLDASGYAYCELQGAANWPEGGANIGLCTLHSAKGLEFDHVFMLGLAQEHVTHGDEAEDDRLANVKRLLAMGASRARISLVLGAKSGEQLKILDGLDRTLVDEIRL